MAKENLEIYQEVFPKSQLRRMKVVDEYLNTFGEMIKKKVISPNCAFEALANADPYATLLLLPLSRENRMEER